MYQGGEDTVVESESSLLKKYGHDVYIYTRDNSDIDNINHARLVIDTHWSTQTTRDISHIVKVFRPNIIHAHNTFPLISPSLYWTANRYSIPIILTLHNFRLFCLQAMFLRDDNICERCIGSLPYLGVLHRCYRGSFFQSAVLFSSLSLHRLLKTYQNKVTSFIVLNQFCKNKFIQAGLPEKKIYVKPNFIDTPDIHRRFRTRPLFVGRLSHEKGIEILLHALDLIDDILVDVIGDGPLSDRVKSHPKIQYHGWLPQDKVIHMMSNASYLIMPSIWYENFPRTIIEAFATGLPVLASNLGALADIIQDHETGILFKPGSHSKLAESILWAQSHPDELNRMGTNARLTYETYYSPETNYNQLIQIYHDTITRF